VPQLYFLAMTVTTRDNLLTNAAFCCLFAAFNRDDELAIPCLFGSKNINLRNIKRKTDSGRSRNGHLFNSIDENVSHSTSSPHLGVPLGFPKNLKDSSKVFRFETEIANVTIPAQASNKKLIAIKLTSKTLVEVPETTDVFKPGRLIFNFAVIDEEKPEGYLKEFDPPIELRVRFEEEDDIRAKAAGKSLQLAFWKEDEERWILFTAEKHNFRLERDESPGTGVFGVAEISHWGDPQVGWGP
jgi:hypothetical protein